MEVLQTDAKNHRCISPKARLVHYGETWAADSFSSQEDALCRVDSWRAALADLVGRV